jgi:hypothetical protein
MEELDELPEFLQHEKLRQLYRIQVEVIAEQAVRIHLLEAKMKVHEEYTAALKNMAKASLN